MLRHTGNLDGYFFRYLKDEAVPNNLVEATKFIFRSCKNTLEDNISYKARYSQPKPHCLGHEEAGRGS